MLYCIITSINKNINIFFDDIIPFIKITFRTLEGTELLTRKFSNTNNIGISKPEVEGFIWVHVETDKKICKKRIYIHNSHKH